MESRNTLRHVKRTRTHIYISWYASVLRDSFLSWAYEWPRKASNRQSPIYFFGINYIQRLGQKQHIYNSLTLKQLLPPDKVFLLNTLSGGKNCLVAPVSPWATETVLSPWLAADEDRVSHVLLHVVWWKLENYIYSPTPIQPMMGTILYSDVYIYIYIYVKQGGIKCHFWDDSTWDWTPVFRAIRRTLKPLGQWITMK